MSDLYLDPEDVIKAKYTPPLQATNPKYTGEDTPPPLVLEETPESSAGSGRSGGRSGTAGKRRPGRTRPSQCDAVLIGQTAPNRPDIAAWAGEHALDSASQSEAEEGEREDAEEEDFAVEPMVGVRNGDVAGHHVDEAGREMVKKATEALKLQIHDIEMPDKPASPQDDKDHENRSENALDSRPSTAATEHTSPQPRIPLDVKPPPRLPPISTSIRSPSRSAGGEEDSIATSPALAKFAITQGNPDNILPAMQKSPPRRTSSAHSPEMSGQTLPSLKTALSQVSETSSNGISYHPATNGHSPSMTRPSPAQHIPGFGPSPVPYTHPSPSTSGMSPPGMITHRSYASWPHHPPRDGSQSTMTPSEYTSNHSQSTPSSAITNPSPANSYPTPISAHQRQDIDGTPQANGTSPTSNGSGSIAPNFKCTYPGCTAPPFQTQYLLNSHANVHSSSRPHFCPVEGCNRGPGGKGFKRKNEMIRHGLVHESPGYQCPFCPDQTHKYPRPDNLQRHVRVHHVDKDRDDALLRQVLAQRPEGPNRGRRRRI